MKQVNIDCKYCDMGICKKIAPDGWNKGYPYDDDCILPNYDCQLYEKGDIKMEEKTTFTPEEKVELLRPELNMINNELIREDTERIVSSMPDYFFAVPASSTGKYHPDYATGYQGLLRHVKAATKIMNDLLSLQCYGMKFDKKRDFMIAAIILHDCCKHGIKEEKYTRHDHPVVAANFIEETLLKAGVDELRVQEYCGNVCPLVESHMGQWNTNKFSKVVLPLPETDEQQFVHMCDYLASRKYLEVKFND